MKRGLGCRGLSCRWLIRELIRELNWGLLRELGHELSRWLVCGLNGRSLGRELGRGLD